MVTHLDISREMIEECLLAIGNLDPAAFPAI
jgi:hypothetical protein